MKTLKANKQEQKLYKQIQQAIEACDEVLEYQYHEHIAFNCKVYTCIDEDQVHAYIDTLDRTEQEKQAFKEYWDQDQINNEFWHILEHEAEYYHDWISGCSVVSQEHINKLKDQIEDGMKTPYPYLNDILATKRTTKTKRKAIDASFADNNKLRKALDYIDPDNVGQYGRSGGQMAITNANAFSEYRETFEHVLETYFSMLKDGLFLNAESNYFGYENLTREQWNDEVFDELQYSPEDIIEECNAILYVIAESEKQVEGLNDENFFLEEIKIRLEDEAYSPGPIPSTLTVKEDHILTSQHVKIPLPEAKRFGNLIKQYEGQQYDNPDITVSHFKGFTSTETYFTVGCHQITWEHALETLKQIQLN